MSRREVFSADTYGDCSVSASVDSRIARLLGDSVFTASLNFFDLGDQSGASAGSRRVERGVLQRLGWRSVKVETDCTIGRLVDTDSLVLVASEIVQKLRQAHEHKRLLGRVIYCERSLRCFSNRWTFYDSLALFEHSLTMFESMGVLTPPEEGRPTFRDFVPPTLHLEEASDQALQQFLQEQACIIVESHRNIWKYQRPENLKDRKAYDAFQTFLDNRPGGRLKGSVVLQRFVTNRAIGALKQLRLHAFLLLVPRRHAGDGLAGFFHPGLVVLRSQPGAASEAASDTPSRSCWTYQQLQTWLCRQRAATDGWVASHLLPRMRAAAAYVTAANAHLVLDSGVTRYVFLRLDFSLDESLNPWMTKVDQNGCWPDSPSSMEVAFLTSLQEEATLLVLELVIKSARLPQLTAQHLTSAKMFTLVFDSLDSGVQAKAMRHLRRARLQ